MSFITDVVASLPVGQQGNGAVWLCAGVRFGYWCLSAVRQDCEPCVILAACAADSCERELW